jgi:hypothetical protein
MSSEATRISVELTGVRPIMFDRYAGDNNTQLAVHDKMYLDEHQGLIIPAINLFSLLAAENTKSVCRQFFGRQGKTIGLGIASYTTIVEMEIPLLNDEGQIVWTGEWTGQLSHVRHVARVKGGIPNPKDRPVIALPWHLRFEVEYIDNKFCTLENLRTAYEMGGTMGLGTFRPYFGRYELTAWSA